MSVKLEVGKKYLNGYGSVVKIISWNPAATYHPYIGDNNVTYTEDGRYYVDCKSAYNLVTEYNPEDLNNVTKT